jgi:hypothetical protein
MVRKGGSMSNEDSGFEILGVITLVVLFSAMVMMTLNRNEAALAVSDCVNDKWEEFESRTGEMPSVELEHEWRKECIETLKGT